MRLAVNVSGQGGTIRKVLFHSLLAISALLAPAALQAGDELLHTLPSSITPAIPAAPSPTDLRTRAAREEVTDWFTEFFSGGDFDLEYKTLTLLPADNPNGYVATLDSAFQYPVAITGGAVDMALGDDQSVEVPLAPSSFPLHGVPYNSVYVSSNGLITMTGPNLSSNPALATHFNTPRISAFHADLQPAAGGGQGTIYRTSLPDRLVLTYDGVQEFDAPRVNNFQVELFYSGTIRITFLKMETKRALVGVSKGGGLPSLLFQSDMHLYTNSGPFAALPFEPVSFIMEAGGDALPSAFPVTLFRKSDGIANWSASTTASWLQVWPSSGSFTSSHVSTSLSTTPTAGFLDPGVYFAKAIFSTTGSEVNTEVAVRLEVTDSGINLSVTDSQEPDDDQVVDYGDVGLGDEVAAQLAVSNASEAPVQIQSVIIDGSYHQDFRDNAAPGWQKTLRPGGDNDWRVEDGRYLAGPSDLSSGFMESTYSLQKFRDVAIEVTIEHTGWDGSFAYVAVRGEPALSGSLVGGTAYLFGISGNNGFTAFKIVNGTVTPILTTSLSPSVTTPPFSNRVRVEAVGPVLQFYVNGYYLGGVVDSSITGAGRIGFVASSVASTDGLLRPAFAFDDIEVQRIPDGSNAFRVAGITSFPTAVPALGDFDFDVLASPSDLVWSTATARILTNDPLRPSMPVFLTANGVAPAIGTLDIVDSILPANDRVLDFGEQLATTTSSIENVTLSNSDGSNPMEIESVYLMNRMKDGFDDPAVPGWLPGNVANWSQADSAYVANAAGTPDIWMYSMWGDAPFGDGTLTLSVSQESADSNSFYVVIRATPDFILFNDGSAGGSALMLGFNSLGLYNLSCFRDGGFRYLQSWLFTDAIHTDGSANEVTFEHIDGRIRAVFNGVEVFEGELPPFIPGGSRVGFFAGSGASGRSYRIHSAVAESIELPGPFNLAGAPFIPTPLAPGGSLPLTVDFSPPVAGLYEAAIRIKSDDFLSPLQHVVLRGTGVVVPFDFTGDGIVNVADVTMLGNHLAGLEPNLPTDGDVNEDGEVDQADVEALATMIVE